MEFDEEAITKAKAEVENIQTQHNELLASILAERNPNKKAELKKKIIASYSKLQEAIRHSNEVQRPTGILLPPANIPLTESFIKSSSSSASKSTSSSINHFFF
jgi:hypothetical protein